MADGVSSPRAPTFLDEDGPAREKRFTVAEFFRLSALGAFNDPYRYELWDGRIVVAPSPGGKHMSAERNLTEALILALHAVGMLATHKVQTGGGVTINELNYREPDIMVLRPVDVEQSYRGEDVFLAIEIANSSLVDDLGEKRTKYAAAEIPEYWVLDVRGRRLHVFRAPRHGDYTAVETFEADGAASPLFAPQIALRVADLV